MKEEKVKVQKLQNLAYGVIRVTGAGIFTFLTGASLIYSQVMPPQGQELPVNRADNPLGNILAAAILSAVIILIVLFEKRLSAVGKKRAETVFLMISMLWVGCCGFWWIGAFDRLPEGDQAFLYAGASYFLEGNYSFLGPGGYCEMYPYQLGLTALMELLFLVVGTYNYYAFEVICVFLSIGIVLLGYCLLKELAVSSGVRILYCLFIMGCIPLICYTSWVYGDVPSIFFIMLTAWLAVRWHNRSGKWRLAGMVSAAIIAVLVRKNSMILLVALGLLAIVYTVRYRRWQMAAAVLLAVIGSMLCYQGVYKMYEYRSGYEHNSGLPINSWIAMGMMENGGVCGWYNNMPKEVLNALNYDYQATEDAMTEQIRDRLGFFVKNPGRAVRFYGKKILSQWNDPLFQSIYFSGKNLEYDSPAQGSFLDGVYNGTEEHERILGFADRMQFLIYLGMLLYFLLAVGKETQPLELLLAVVIIGGFFFSILWEAKARYIFPYYVMMYPLAAAGYFKLSDIAAGSLRQNI